MQINVDGVEIENVDRMEVYGDWVKFTDNDGAVIKIPPYVIKELLAFALEHAEEFPKDAWDGEYEYPNVDRNAVLQELLPEIEKLFGLKYKQLENKEE